MERILKTIGTILLILVGGYLLWRFSFLIVYMLIAAVVSFIGHPVVRFFDKLRIGRFHIPHAISTFLTLLLLLSCLLSLVALFVPLIMQEAQTIAQIDLKKFTTELQGPLARIQHELNKFGLLPPGQNLQSLIAEKAKSIVSIPNLTSIVNGFLGVAGSLFIDLFSIVFIAFFFLKDDQMFENILLLLLPEKHADAIHKVLINSRRLLRRYFIGVTIEIIGGMTLITLGLLALGVKNALLLGFFGGLMNIIPYVGPILGSVLGLTLGFTSAIASGEYSTLSTLAIKIASVLFSVHYLDTWLFQPIIYSNSVKAHPLEIFLVIVIGGSVGGIVGMLIAVPSYTLLRVIAREFFSRFRLVKKLTENI